MNRRTDSFAARLRTLRESSGLSISALASAAEMPRQTVHNYENGVRQPTLANAARLARALGQSVAVFE